MPSIDIFAQAPPEKLTTVNQLSVMQARWLNEWGIRTAAGPRVVARFDVFGNHTPDYYQLKAALAEEVNNADTPMEIELAVLDLAQNLSPTLNARVIDAAIGSDLVGLATTLPTIFPHNFDFGRFVTNVFTWKATNPPTTPPINPVQGV